MDSPDMAYPATSGADSRRELLRTLLFLVSESPVTLSPSQSNTGEERTTPHLRFPGVSFQPFNPVSKYLPVLLQI